MEPEPEPEPNLSEGNPTYRPSASLPHEKAEACRRMREASRKQLAGIGGVSISGLERRAAQSDGQRWDTHAGDTHGNTVYFPADKLGDYHYFETKAGAGRREYKLFCHERETKENCVWVIGDVKMDHYADPYDRSLLFEEAEAVFVSTDGLLPVGVHEWNATPHGSSEHAVLLTISLLPPQGALSMEEDPHTVVLTMLGRHQKPGIVFGKQWPKVKALKHGCAAESTPGLKPGCRLLAINHISVGQMNFDDAKPLITERPLSLLFAKPEMDDALTPDTLNKALVQEDWEAVERVLDDHRNYRHLFFLKTTDGRHPYTVAEGKNAPPELVQMLRDMHEPLQDVLARAEWDLARGLVNRMPLLSSILDPRGERGLPLHSAAHYNAPLDVQVAIGLAYPSALAATASFMPCDTAFGRRRPVCTAFEIAVGDSEWSRKAPVEVAEFLRPDNRRLLELASNGAWEDFVMECSKLLSSELPFPTKAVDNAPWIRLVAREAPACAVTRLVQLTDPYDLEVAISNKHWHAIDLFGLATSETCCIPNSQHKLPLLHALELNAPLVTVKKIVDAYPQACSQPGGSGFELRQELMLVKGSLVRAKPGCEENPRDPRPVSAGREGTVVSSWENWMAIVKWQDGSQSMDIQIQHLEVRVGYEWRSPFPNEGVIVHVRRIPGNAEGFIDYGEPPPMGRVGVIVSGTMAKGGFVDVVWAHDSPPRVSQSQPELVHICFLEPGELVGEYYGSRKEPIEVAIEHNATVETIEFLANRHPHGLATIDSTGNAFRQSLLMGHKEEYHQLANCFGATLGRYNVVSKIHKSKTAWVMLAKDMLDQSRTVCLKFMRHRSQFLNEIDGRLESTTGEVLPSTCMIELLRWHTPEDHGHTATKTGQPLEVWQHGTSVTCRQGCVDSFGTRISYGRKGKILGITGETGKSKLNPKKVLCKIGWIDTLTHTYTQYSQIFAEHLEADRTEELQFTQIDDEFPYILVLEAGECSLHSACATERIAGYEIDAITSIFRDIVLCVKEIHKAGVLHADLKPRNVLRLEIFGKKRWLLCDMDAATSVGQPVGEKTSSAYAPPELAKVKARGCSVLSATFSFDIWSLGVLLFELCCGRTLFSQDISNDELIDTVDQTRLCVWHTISDEELRPVLHQVEPTPDPALVESARDLIRWCLNGVASERPTIDMILDHPFLNPQAATMPGRPMRHYAFMSHCQADASSTVSSLFLLYKSLGLHNWLDMRQSKLTLEGMRQGVHGSKQFLLVLTRHVLGSWYCQQEILCAIESRKPVQLILEEDARFSPFDIETWTASKGDAVRRFTPDHILVVSSDKEVPWQKSLGDDALADKIAQLIDENLPEAVTYRRRDYEVNAMMRELCVRSDLVLPRDALGHSEDTSHSSTVTVFVVRNDDTSEEMWRQLQSALDGKGNIRLTSRPDELISADAVLLLLTAGVLTGKSLQQLQDTIRVDRGLQQDRIVALYSENAGWSFGCEEQTQAPADIQACLSNHEAITYRPADPGGRSRHEFQAMIAKLASKLCGFS